MATEDEFEKDLTIYPFLDRMTFTMEEFIDWPVVDAQDDSRPSSRQYRRFMRETGISGRYYSRGLRRMKKDDYWD